MDSALIHDRGRGPELIGTRITVYNLLPYLLDPAVTEEDIAKLYGLTREQIAAVRSYALVHADTVLEQHLKIEARIAAGNPPEVIAAAERSREMFAKFRDWYAQHREWEKSTEAPESKRLTGRAQLMPAFKQWLAESEANSVQG